MPDLPREAAPSTYARATWLFLRLLGLVYLIAFWSLGVQIRGLVGHDGILPADQYMAGARTLTGLSRFWLLPTLAWAGTSDGFLQALCISGGALASLLLAGILPSAVLPLLWLIYLSLSIVCRDFLAFQWDTLLLETGFLAIFLAPFTRRERLRRLVDPPRVAVWLMLWLLFRADGGIRRREADERRPHVAQPDGTLVSLRDTADSDARRLVRPPVAPLVSERLDDRDVRD
jgi:hypothetical protein